MNIYCNFCKDPGWFLQLSLNYHFVWLQLREEKGKNISERKRREEKRKRRRFPYICLGNGEERRKERRCNLFLTCKGKRKEKNKKFIEEIIFKYKLEFRIDNRMFF